MIWLSLLCLAFSGNEAKGEGSCPEAPFSGLDYAPLKEYILDKKTLLEQFIPTKVPVVKGILPPSYKREEEKEKAKRKYKLAHITNDLDFEIRDELDKWNKIMSNSPKKAHNKFKQLYKEYKSPRGLFGMATALNLLALDTNDQGQAAQIQGKAVGYFCQVLSLPDVPLFLFMSAGRTCLELRRYRQERGELIAALELMKKKFPNSYEYSSELALEYLKRKQFSKAIKALSSIVKRWPQKAEKEKFLLGFSLKWQHLKNPMDAIERQDQEAIELISKPIKSLHFQKVSQSIKSLSDFYLESGSIEEASFFYETGANIGIFPSKWQRQLYDNNFYLKGLESRPIWNLSQIPTDIDQSLKSVANHWKLIKNEALEALFGSHENYKQEAENLQAEGQWQQLVLFEKSVKNEKGCQLAPRTCQLLEKHPKLISCTRGQIKFSVMHPDSHVLPHSGPTNTRLRAHLGLVIPTNGNVKMRIANETARWSEGKIFIIDDSFEHEVWQKGDTIRLVMLIDFWHPDVPETLRQTLPPLPIDEGMNRTTVFHIGGIVKDIASSVSRQNSQAVITEKLTGNL